jgi:hypothetical protein
MEINVRGRLMKSSTPVEGVTTTSVLVGAAEAAGYAIDNWPAMATDAVMLAEAAFGCRPDVVRDTLNVAQEIGEMLEVLRSVKDLFNTAEKFFKQGSWRSNPQILKLLKKRAPEKWTLRDWLLFVTQLDLAYKFAVKPFIATIRKMNQLEERVDRVLQRVTGEVATLHGRSKRSGTLSYTNTSSPYQRYGNNRVYTKEVCCTVKVQYSSARTLALRNRIRDALGGARMNYIPSAAYELTPMSFILDMFVDFGGFLRQWALEPIDDIGYTILDSCWSTKTVAYSEGWVDPFSSGVYIDQKTIESCPLVTGSLTKSTYYRRAEPFSLSAISIPPPTWNFPDMGRLLTIGEVIVSIANKHHELIRRPIR